MEPVTIETITRRLYLAYANHSRLAGVRMVKWEELPKDIRERWMDVAREALRLDREGYMELVGR